jgi:mono/diheme cytochrome c family protein
MTKSRLVAILGAALLLGAGAQFGEAHGPGHNPSRHHYVMRHGIPTPYRELLNPLRMLPENLSSGQDLYNTNCVVCHGATGEGGGEGVAALNPAPPTLTGMYDRPMPSMGYAGPGGHMMHGKMHHHPGMTHAEAMGGTNLDAYTFWSISEGGEPTGSSMPAFKNTLSETERWQVLLYIANGFNADASN